MGEIFLPTEIISNILKYLNPDDIPKCRLISRQWRDTVDYFMYTNESLWEEYGKQKFPNEFVRSKNYTPKAMANFQLFRSLVLWDSLDEANIVVTCEQIKTPGLLMNLQVLEYGKIGIHSKYSILYYNYITKEVETASISGIYVKYVENSEYLVVLNIGDQMIINTKQLYDADQKQQTMIPSVSDFILEGNYVYYTEQHNYTVNSLTFSDGKMQCKVLFHSPSTIKYWSVKGDGVTLMTISNELLCYENGTLHYFSKCPIGLCDSLQLRFFKKATFLNCQLWSDYLNTYPGATCIVTYNKLVFIGTKCGTISVCREATPAKRIKTFCMDSAKEHSDKRIISIKICEEINSHRLLVLTPNQLYTVMITH